MILAVGIASRIAQRSGLRQSTQGLFGAGLFAGLVFVSPLVSVAQITVGGNGSDTIDSTAYTGNQTLPLS